MNCVPQCPASGNQEHWLYTEDQAPPRKHPPSSSASRKMDATKQIKFLTYNVWSREDIFVYKRMQAIGALVDKHDPDVIFFQEVTPYIRSIFEDLAWWNKYHCSPVPPEEQPFCLLLSKLPLENFARWKFGTSPTGRFYLEADINPQLGPAAAAMKPIRVATTQLERPSPPAPMRCVERYAQAEHAVAALSSAENVVLGGDMCWRDGTDRPFPLPPGWFDAWPSWLQDLTRLHHGGRHGGKQGEPNDPDAAVVYPATSWSYDGMWEEEVGLFNGFAAPYEWMYKRSDRFVCKLKDYVLEGMEIIGDAHTDAVLWYANSKRDYSGHALRNLESVPLGPSCHRGLLMTIAPKEFTPKFAPRQSVEQQWMASWGDLDSM